MRASPVLLLLLAACASAPMTDEQAEAVIARHGPACGVTDRTTRLPADDPELRRAAQCIAARIHAERGPTAVQSLGIGMQNAGAILNPDVYAIQRGYTPAPAPTPAPAYRQVDLVCMQNCSALNYGYPLCQSRCSY